MRANSSFTPTRPYATRDIRKQPPPRISWRADRAAGPTRDCAAISALPMSSYKWRGMLLTWTVTCASQHTHARTDPSSALRKRTRNCGQYRLEPGPTAVILATSVQYRSRENLLNDRLMGNKTRDSLVTWRHGFFTWPAESDDAISSSEGHDAGPRPSLTAQHLNAPEDKDGSKDGARERRVTQDKGREESTWDQTKGVGDRGLTAAARAGADSSRSAGRARVEYEPSSVAGAAWQESVAGARVHSLR